jgi:hypothetical protein
VIKIEKMTEGNHPKTKRIILHMKALDLPLVPHSQTKSIKSSTYNRSVLDLKLNRTTQSEQSQIACKLRSSASSFEMCVSSPPRKSKVPLKV